MVTGIFVSGNVPVQAFRSSANVAGVRDDQNTIQTGESSASFVNMTREDGVPIGLTDAMNALLARLVRDDIPAILIADASVITIPITTSDVLRILLSESSIAEVVRLGNVLIATVRSLTPEKQATFLSTMNRTIDYQAIRQVLAPEIEAVLRTLLTQHRVTYLSDHAAQTTARTISQLIQQGRAIYYRTASQSNTLWLETVKTLMYLSGLLKTVRVI